MTSSQVQTTSEPAEVKQFPSTLWRFIITVVSAALALTVVGAYTSRSYDIPFLIVLLTGTLIAEIFNVNLYGQGSVSVTAALTFAAVLTEGVVGVSWIGLAGAIGARIALYRNEGRPFEIQKVLFNWATHTLAGGIPALIITTFDLTPTVDHLLQMFILTVVLALPFFALETGLIATIIGIASGQKSLDIWRTQYRWLLGHYVVLLYTGLFLAVAYTQFSFLGLTLFVFPLLVLRYAMLQYTIHTSRSIAELKRINNELAQANEETRQANRQISALNDDLFETLSRFFDARDPYVGSHTFTVAEYATAIARELQLPDERVKLIRQAAILHDIGKIAIPEQILHKPGRLTDEEFALMRLHAEIGAALLEESASLRHLAIFVRHHHERWDGRGYPEGLAATQIPLEARILNICDSVEAMASDRPYHRAMSHDEVIAELKRCAGTQFDPVLVEIFLLVVQRETPSFIINSAQRIDSTLSKYYFSQSPDTSGISSAS